jgi:hypothetical protein
MRIQFKAASQAGRQGFWVAVNLFAGKFFLEAGTGFAGGVFAGSFVNTLGTFCRQFRLDKRFLSVRFFCITYAC